VVPRVFVAPANATPTARHNWIATQKEAISFGPTDAASSFLPVLLARLGATNVQVGLLTAIPGLVGFLLAIPVGHFLQSRRNAVPWYSRCRFINQLTLAAIGLALILVPLDQVVPVILALIAVGSVIGSFANFSFYTVMDGLSGPHGRYELMGRRWGMKGLATAISLAVIGWLLAQVPFPHSYQLVLLATAVAAAVGFWFSRTFRIPNNPVRPPAHGTAVVRARAFTREIAGERRFLGFLGRHAIFAFGLSMAVPLIPLYYVRELGAGDGVIGLLGTTQALATMAGYFLSRGPARRSGGASVLVPSTIGAALFPPLLGMAHNDVIVGVFVAMYGVCLAGIDLAVFDELMQSIPGDQQVRFAAMDQGASNFAAMTGPIVGAVLAAQFGIPGGLFAAGAIGLVGAALFAWSVVRRRRAAALATSRAAPAATTFDAPAEALPDR
jgi:hypothetical protein